jgi:hypothetical protein
MGARHEDETRHPATNAPATTGERFLARDDEDLPLSFSHPASVPAFQPGGRPHVMNSRHSIPGEFDD